MPGVALVTGASRGVGRACALALAADGHDVGVCFAVSEEAARDVAAAVEARGRRAVIVQGDVRTEAGCHALAEQTADALGPVTVLVSNATGFPAGTTREELGRGFDARLGPTLGMPGERFREMFDARVLALLLLARATVPTMPRGSSIIALTSTGTAGYFPGYGPTAVAMSGVHALIRYLAVELGPAGIRANVVSGGPIHTDALGLMARDTEKLIASFAASTPMGRVGEPDDLARVVAFLAGPGGEWITGQVVVADGGQVVT